MSVEAVAANGKASEVALAQAGQKDKSGRGPEGVFEALVKGLFAAENGTGDEKSTVASSAGAAESEDADESSGQASKPPGEGDEAGSLVAAIVILPDLQQEPEAEAEGDSPQAAHAGARSVSEHIGSESYGQAELKLSVAGDKGSGGDIALAQAQETLNTKAADEAQHSPVAKLAPADEAPPAETVTSEEPEALPDAEEALAETQLSRDSRSEEAKHLERPDVAQPSEGPEQDKAPAPQASLKSEYGAKIISLSTKGDESPEASGPEEGPAHVKDLKPEQPKAAVQGADMSPASATDDADEQSRPAPAPSVPKEAAAPDAPRPSALEEAKVGEIEPVGPPEDGDMPRPDERSAGGLDVAKTTAPQADAKAPTDGAAQPARPAAPPVVERLVEKVMEVVQGDKGVNRHEVSIELSPPSLGRVHLTLLVEDSKLQVALLTTTSQAKELVESHAAQLKDALHAQGLRLEEFSVGVRSGLAHNMPGYDWSGGQDGPYGGFAFRSARNGFSEAPAETISYLRRDALAQVDLFV